MSDPLPIISFSVYRQRKRFILIGLKLQSQRTLVCGWSHVVTLTSLEINRFDICLSLKHHEKMIKRFNQSKGVLGAELANVLQPGNGASGHRQPQRTPMSEQLDQKWHLDWQLQLLDGRNTEGLQRKLVMVWQGWRSDVQRGRHLGQRPTGQQGWTRRLHPSQVEKECYWTSPKIRSHR
jgi:hypothetical protein